MRTEDIVNLINAHYEGDEAAFKRVATEIAAHEAINEHAETTRKITAAITGEHAAKETDVKRIYETDFIEGKNAFAVYPDGEIVRIRVQKISLAGVSLENGDVYERRIGRQDCLICSADTEISSDAHRLFPTLTQARQEQKKCRMMRLIKEELDGADNNCSWYTVPQLKRVITALGINEGPHVN